MKSLLKKALMAIAILIALGIAAIMIISDKSPKVIPTESADEIANKMLTALNYKAFDTMKIVTWKSRMGVKYTWNKPLNSCVIEWGNVKVDMDLNTVAGKVYKDGKLVEDKDAIDKAWNFWCNDSFWMFAHYKLFDKGTTRSLVPVENGKIGLMISYESGGVTPGDKYLWMLNEKHIPEGFKMWVKIIPIGGTYASWEGWKQLENGVMVAPKHKMKVMEFEFTDIAVVK